VAALRNAISPRVPQGTIVHSDRGSQCRSRKYALALDHARPHGSMDGRGLC
jgi:hypothetical protein